MDIDISGRTIDADLSLRSGTDCDWLFANLTSSCNNSAGHHLKSCLRVRTQSESLARISQPVLPPRAPNMTSSVRFDSVEFREYRRSLSDSAATSSGPPIGIDWKYNPKDTVLVDLDQYEFGRVGSRRTKQELTIPPVVRETILREAGYSRNQIALATKSVRNERERRIKSTQRQKFDPLMERVEAVKQGVKQMMVSPNKRRESFPGAELKQQVMSTNKRRDSCPSSNSTVPTPPRRRPSCRF